MNPFTGYKIGKQLIIQGTIPPKVLRYLIFSHCLKGKLDYQKKIEIVQDMEEMWYHPIEILERNSMALREPTKIADSKLTSLVSESNAFYNKLFKFKDSKFLKFARQSRNNQSQSRNNFYSLPRTCFKLARKKQFARHSLSYYIPLTFVGALFNCSHDADMEACAVNISHTESFACHCDELEAVPLMPLVAEDTTRQWMKLRLLRYLGTSLEQTIPLFTTVNPRHLQFSLIGSRSANCTVWAKNISVNEDYRYSKQDETIFIQALISTADLIHKVTNPISSGLLFAAAKTGLKPELHEMEVKSNNIQASSVSSLLTPDDTLGLALAPGAMSRRMKRLPSSIVKKIQQLWRENDTDDK